MLVTEYSSLTATDGSGLPLSATWTITHSWQTRGWLIRLSNWREHKTAIYFIINFMLELVSFSHNKSLNPWLERYNGEKLWKRKKIPFTISVPVLLEVPKWFLATHVYLPSSALEMLVMRRVPSSMTVCLRRGTTLKQPITSSHLSV